MEPQPVSSISSASPKNSTNGRTVPPSVRSAFSLADRWAPAWGARFARGLFLTPPRFGAPADEAAVIATATAFELPVTIQGRVVSLAAWRWDDDPLGLEHRPVAILVHGWGGRGGQLHPFVAPLVAAGFSVLTFDMPAHGASPGRQTNIPELAWALAGVARHVGSPSLLVTHSLGGGAALLASTADWVEPSLRQPLRRTRVAFLAPPLELAIFTRTFGQQLGLGERTLGHLETRFRAEVGVSWNEVAFAPAAARFSAPALVAHDRADTEVPLEAGLAFARNLGNVEVHITEGLGHRRILKDPTVIDRVLRFASA